MASVSKKIGDRGQITNQKPRPGEKKIVEGLTPFTAWPNGHNDCECTEQHSCPVYFLAAPTSP